MDPSETAGGPLNPRLKHTNVQDAHRFISFQHMRSADGQEAVRLPGTAFSFEQALYSVCVEYDALMTGALQGLSAAWCLSCRNSY